MAPFPFCPGLGQAPGGPSLRRGAREPRRRPFPWASCLHGRLVPQRWVPPERPRSILSPSAPPPGLPGCSSVIYWRLLLTRAHGGRSSNTRRKATAIDPASGLLSAGGHSSRSRSAGLQLALSSSFLLPPKSFPRGRPPRRGHSESSPSVCAPRRTAPLSAASLL